MTGHGLFDWDEEPWSEADPARRRAWHHPWIPYLAVWVGAVGLVLAIGSAGAPGWRTLGGLLVLASPLAITRADGPYRRPGSPRPPAPPWSVTLGWLGVAATMVVVGTWLFAR